MSDATDDIPLPSEPILSEEESSRQLRDDFTKQDRLRIAALEAQLAAAKEEIERLRVSEANELVALRARLADLRKIADGLDDAARFWLISFRKTHNTLPGDPPVLSAFAAWKERNPE